MSVSESLSQNPESLSGSNSSTESTSSQSKPTIPPKSEGVDSVAKEVLAQPQKKLDETGGTPLTPLTGVTPKLEEVKVVAKQVLPTAKKQSASKAPEPSAREQEIYREIGRPLSEIKQNNPTKSEEVKVFLQGVKKMKVTRGVGQTIKVDQLKKLYSQLKISIPTFLDKLQGTDELMILARGTKSNSLVEMAKDQSVAGGPYEMGTRVPDEEALKKQVGLNETSEKAKTRYDFSLPEFSNKLEVARGFAKGQILMICAIPSTYLAKGSGSEGGMIANPRAPAALMYWEVGGEKEKVAATSSRPYSQPGLPKSRVPGFPLTGFPSKPVSPGKPPSLGKESSGTASTPSTSSSSSITTAPPPPTPTSSPSPTSSTSPPTTEPQPEKGSDSSSELYG